MSGEALNSAHATDAYPQQSKLSTAAGQGLSRPLKELIARPTPEQFRTAARILGLVDAVQKRLDLEAAQRKAGAA
ncbi:hypothetical protein [Nonomuraea bangladeshensis]|uniref:hypothetical protein n=1 Tax=Nonomuraea bangladeshensis TaxID=404385 RepID=UPI003C2B9171